MAIIGGALLPLLAGAITDASSRSLSFFVPACGYVGLFLFALAAGRAPVNAAKPAPLPA